MKKDKKVYMKRALIVFPIVLVLVGTTLMGAYSALFMPQESPRESAVVGESIDDIVKDEKALKILDIHENLNNYLDKEVVLEGYILPTGADTKAFGVEVPLENGEMTMTSLAYDASNPEVLKGIKETDLVKATGKITSFEQEHAEEGEESHTHTLPKFNIEKIEVVR